MATPYFQLQPDEVTSTQDVAREALQELPVLVLADRQTTGRGRSGAEWWNSDRALAVSLAYRHDLADQRPLPLMAGLAAVAAIPGTTLKWPNDVMKDEVKVGGILVERSGEVTVIGLGLNLWWERPPDGARSVFDGDPGPGKYREVGALWGAELLELIDRPGWPKQRYLEACTTPGKEITWEPDGRGRAVDIADDGGLVVVTGTETLTLHSGAVRHIRAADDR